MSLEQRLFLELVQTGLWEQDVELKEYGASDFSNVLRLAREQSVVGLVAAGLERVKDVKVLHTVSLAFAREMLQLEQRNLAMIVFVAELIERLRKDDIYTLLVKGQGVARCYEKPLWRVCGDVDLFLSESNYEKAAKTLAKVATYVGEETTYNRHIAMTIDGWSVELHGTLRSGLWRGLDRVNDEVQGSVFLGGNVRLWKNGQTQVSLPGPNEDVFFVFSHILQHFYKEGIGLRHICDWCRLLWTFRKSLNSGLLEKRVRNAGIMTEWKTFYNLACRYLGMPDLGSGLLVCDTRYNKKADKVMVFVLETGNFGHNRDYSYYKDNPYVVFKAISFWRHLTDTYRYFQIFPLDSIKVLMRKMLVGLCVAIRGKKHE